MWRRPLTRNPHRQGWRSEQREPTPAGSNDLTPRPRSDHLLLTGLAVDHPAPVPSAQFQQFQPRLCKERRTGPRNLRRHWFRRQNRPFSQLHPQTSRTTNYQPQTIAYHIRLLSSSNAAAIVKEDCHNIDEEQCSVRPLHSRLPTTATTNHPQGPTISHARQLAISLSGEKRHPENNPHFPDPGIYFATAGLLQVPSKKFCTPIFLRKTERKPCQNVRSLRARAPKQRPSR